MADATEEPLLHEEDSVTLDGELGGHAGEGDTGVETAESGGEDRAIEAEAVTTPDRDIENDETWGEEELNANDENGGKDSGASVEAPKEERKSERDITVSEVTTQYLAVHQELLLRPLEDSEGEELLVRLLGEESVSGGRAEELLREFPLLSLLHGKHMSQGGSAQRFWANVAAVAASGVHLNSPAPVERENERGEKEKAEVTGVSSKPESSSPALEVRDESSGDVAERSLVTGRSDEAKSVPLVAGRESDAEGREKSAPVREKVTTRTADGDRRAAAMALSESGRESIELEMEEEEDDSLVMEIGEKQNPARYIVSAVMAVIKIVIVLALLQEYEAPLLFYLYPILWVFIFFLLIIRAVQIVIANKAIDKANARLATELLPLDPHSDEEEEGEYDMDDEEHERL